MQPLTLSELKKYQLDILDTVAEFCNENDIKYWITGGTLLGAVRHKGYIPWDDDIDICMMRDDYEKFAEKFEGYSDRYKLYKREFGKIIDTNTVLYEPDESGRKLCVNIDVFVNDNTPNDEQLINKIYDTRDYYRRKLIDREQSKNRRVTGVHSMWMYICGIFSRLIPEKYYFKKLEENAKSFREQETGYIADFCGYYYGQPRIAVKKELFGETVMLDFEEKKYSAPQGYDEWLTALYGDYMQLPPPEKRVSHHTFKAYKLEDSIVK